jgi:hypothetical protein
MTENQAAKTNRTAAFESHTEHGAGVRELTMPHAKDARFAKVTRQDFPSIKHPLRPLRPLREARLHD